MDRRRAMLLPVLNAPKAAWLVIWIFHPAANLHVLFCPFDIRCSVRHYTRPPLYDSPFPLFGSNPSGSAYPRLDISSILWYPFIWHEIILLLWSTQYLCKGVSCSLA